MINSANHSIPAQELLAKIIHTQSEIIGAGLDLQHVMRTIAQRTQEVTGATGAVMELVEGDEMVYHSVSGSASGQLGLRLQRNQSLSGLAVNTKAILNCTDSETDPRVDREACRRVGARSMIVVPLYGLPTADLITSATSHSISAAASSNAGDVDIHTSVSPHLQAIGVLKVLSDKPNAFGEKELEALRLMAGLVSAALSNAAAFREREELLAILRSSEARFRSLAEASFEAIFISVDGVIVDANQNSATLLGYTREELIGHRVTEFASVTKVSQIQEEVKNVASEYKSEAVHKSGKRIPVEIHGRSIGISTGSTALPGVTPSDADSSTPGNYRISALRDITQQQEFERQLQDARASAIYANEMKSRFLFDMSHELRTPLNGIMGYSDLVMTGGLGPVNAEQQRALATVIKSAKHLLDVLNDVLDIGKVESGKMELQVEACDPWLLVSEVVNDQMVLAQARKISLNLENYEDLSELDKFSSRLITLDPRKFKQILYNLVSNAIKFTKEGGRVTITMGIAKRTFAQSKSLSVIVRDTGIGMSEEDLSELFQEFSQIDSELGRKSRGTGLGLLLTKQLVELHGGTLRVESIPNVGTSFFIHLPIEGNI